MAYRDTLQARRDLRALAAGQGGYFTAKQARAAGYGYAHLAYHAGAGTFERAGPGLYRLADVPPSEHDDLVRLALWSRDWADLPQAVASYDTALALHGLGELLSACRQWPTCGSPSPPPLGGGTSTRSPTERPPPPASWASDHAALAAEAQLPAAELADGYALVAAFWQSHVSPATRG